MTDSRRRPTSHGNRPASQGPSGRRGRPSTSPSGTSRAGRRETARPGRAELTPLARLRVPLITLAVVFVVAGASLFALSSATSPAYACSTVDTVKPASSGEIGQVQSDQGMTIVPASDKVTYIVCPPASGKQVSRNAFGPLQPASLGPDDQSTPMVWLHNLQAGALVLLYSCDKGACGDATIAQLRAFSSDFPDSPVCGLKAGLVGPVIARFEQMPTKIAALVWDRVLYLDTLDVQKVYDFYTAYGERVAAGGTWITPPTPQCLAPSPSPGPSASQSPGPSASPSPGPSASPSAAASAAPTSSPAASASAEPSPSGS